MDYSGSNSLNNLQNITKETYAKDISYNITDNKPKKRFKKIRKKLKGK